VKYILVLFLFPLIAFSQGGFKKGVKGDDYRIVTKNGYHFAFGPTYMFSSETIHGFLSDNNGARGEYHINPDGKFGVFAEFGFLQFPSWKGTPIKFLKKSRIMDYMEFAIGYRELAGIEKTTINVPEENSINILTSENTGSFRNGHVFFRTSFHSLIFVGKKKIDKTRKYFIDQSIGLNFDYNLFPGAKTYPNNFILNTNIERKFYNPSVLQFHYGLSFGIRLNRAWMVLPGASLPIIGIYEWNSNTPRWNLSKMNWFSSQYNPIQFHIKFIKLFERAPKCNAHGSANDIKLDQQYRMGN
jgi:hypothetical protein